MAEPGVTIEPIPEEENSEKKLSQDAIQNFLQGKRHMVVHDYSNAVASLGDACQLYAEHFGETALECGEVYFHYGKALFRLFQQQSGIIANVGSEESSTTDEEPKVSDSEEDKEKEIPETTTSNDEEDIEEDENAEETAEKEENAEDLTSTKDEDDEIKDDTPAKDKDGVIEENSTKDKIVKETPMEEDSVAASESKPSDKETDDHDESKSSPDLNETNADQDESKSSPDLNETNVDQDLNDSDLNQAGPSRPKTEEEISDLQLAWETLETAKAVFTKHSSSNKENRLKVGEILLILAEISMELENYSAAVDDLHECLAIREMYLSEDNRLIAETYYQLGLVFTFDSQVSKAMASYQKSVDCIMLRIENLRKETGILKTPEGYDLLPAEEIKELEALLPDIKAKMEDTQDMVQDTKNLLFQELSMQNMEVASGSSGSDKPVTNITHLLKRKKPDDPSVASTSECKKIKLSNASNGQDQVPVDASQSSVTNEKPANA